MITLIHVAAPVSELLNDIAHRGTIPPTLVLSAMASGTWAGRDLSTHGGRLEHDEEGLRLMVAVDFMRNHAEVQAMMRTRNAPASLVLADGSTVEADLAHMPHAGAEATVSLHHWRWRSSKPPIAWMGTLFGHLPSLGNLQVCERSAQSSRSKQGFALWGRHRWYLLETDTRRSRGGSVYTVVLDPQGEDLVRDAVLRDILAMELAFGCPLQLNVLVGVDINRTAVGAMSTERVTRRVQAPRPPVPNYLSDGSVWPPAFFRDLSSAFSGVHQDALRVAAAAYLDSTADHLDGAYLKAQVGLEGVAQRLLQGRKRDLLVADPDDWKAWVDSLLPEIAKRLGAAYLPKAKMIAGKFKAAMHPPSGSRVEDAFRALGTSLPDGMLEEVAKRNYPAHQFTMNAVGVEFDFDADTRRLEIVQTLLAALVAKCIGYDGPLEGYDVAEDGGRKHPPWWAAATTQEHASIRYVALRTT